MFAKIKNEMQKNKKLALAIISIPILVYIAVNSLYKEFKGEPQEASQSVKNKTVKSTSKKVAPKKNISKSKSSTKGKKVVMASPSSKYAKMSLVELKKTKQRLEAEQKELEKTNQKFIEKVKGIFWLYSQHGDPVIALPTMIEKVAKSLDLKISSLSSIRRTKGSNGYDIVEVSISCMKDMDTVIKFLNKLENGDPKIYWSRSSIRPYRSRASTISFSGTANVLLLTDPEIGVLLQGSKWRTPPADVKSSGGGSYRKPSSNKNNSSSNNNRKRNYNSNNSKNQNYNKNRNNQSKTQKNKNYKRNRRTRR